MIDVIIPAHEKESSTLELCVAAAKENIIGVKDVYVISKTKLTDNAIWFPEDRLPFSINDIAKKIGSHWRTGWYYGDLLEGCASLYVGGTSQYTLILDADTIFLRPVNLIEDGKVLFNTSPTDGTAVYNEYMRRLIPGLTPQHKHSGVVHWILQENSIVREMISMVEDIHKKDFWKAALDVACQKYDCLPEGERWQSCELGPGKMASFELYFTYALKNHPNKVKVKNQKSILAYKESLGFPGYTRTDVSRTNTQGKTKIFNDEELQKINFLEYPSLEEAIRNVCTLCTEKGWDVASFHSHFWIGLDDYKKLNSEYMQRQK